MPNRDTPPEYRIEELATQVQELARRIEALEMRLERSPAIAPTESKTELAETGPEEASEKMLDWVGKSSLLQRLATFCFLMVTALILRTLTDNDILSKGVGSLLGMGYAAALMTWGWFLYARRSPLSPVFSGSGAFLLFAIIVETHEHFESLPTVPAYLLLTLAGTAMVSMSLRFKVALPVFVGTLGMCFAGVALDFPNPIFPYLFVLLLVANIMGTFATRLQRCSWLRWILLGVTVFMMQVWGFRLGIYLSKTAPADLPFSVSGIFPALIIFGLAFLAIAAAGVLGRITDRISRFDLALPTVNVIWIYIIARYVVNAGQGNGTLLGAFGVASALGHFALSFWLYRRNAERLPGSVSFAIAGSVLLAMALPAATGSSLISLAIFSALALGISILSQRWRSGGLRLLSYLLQFYACGALALQLRSSEATEPSALGAVASGALAVIALKHYLWARHNPPPAESSIFSRFDNKDRGVALLLAAALAGGFFTLRVGLFQALNRSVPPETLTDAFASGQSVLINAAAAVLMCYAFSKRDKLVRNVAILVTVLGAGKVFLLDLFGLKGVPVVASMLSFGVTAFLESFALSRWQRIDTLRVSKWPQEEEERTMEKQ